MAAKDFAVALAKRFLQSGNFVLAGAQGRSAAAILPAGAEPEGLAPLDEYGFAGLAVQSVGVEESQSIRVHH